MAVKSKKKVVKKTVKKVVKAKKTIAKRPSVKSVKKAPKKVVKKTTAKTAPKAAPKNKVKKVAKVIKKSTPVKTVAKKAAAPKKIEKVIVKKTAAVSPVVAKQKMQMPVTVEKTITPAKPLISKTIPKKKPMTVSTYDAVEDNVVMDASPSKKATTLLGALEFTPYQAKEGEAYMNEHQRVHFRKILDAWKQQLMQDVDTTVGHLKEEAVFYADPVDRASQEEGFNLELRTRDRERRLIKKIEQSLDLLNTGEYGFCEDCGADIGIRRLEARPTAVKCIDCKTFQEIREKQLGG